MTGTVSAARLGMSGLFSAYHVEHTNSNSLNQKMQQLGQKKTLR